MVYFGALYGNLYRYRRCYIWEFQEKKYVLKKDSYRKKINANIFYAFFVFISKSFLCENFASIFTKMFCILLYPIHSLFRVFINYPMMSYRFKTNVLRISGYKNLVYFFVNFEFYSKKRKDKMKFLKLLLTSFLSSRK